MACRTPSFHRILMTQSSGNRKDNFPATTKPPAEQFGLLASKFGRRLLLGTGSASLVAVGANFGGLTSFLLGLSPDTGRNLKLDVVYPIGGYRRCIDTTDEFEFIYPANWVGDQTLLYRAAARTELQRSLDPPPLNNSTSTTDRRRRSNVNEPAVAFGPPGSTGELNVSVIVSPVPPDFSIEAFGGAEEVGRAIVRTIAGRRPDQVKGTLMKSSLRLDSDDQRNVKYYEIEFRVESPAFRRHNVAVCCAVDGRLFTLNAQAPESGWIDVEKDFRRIAESFRLVTS
ncbi:PsbP domain-containing protein 7, chloroplastic [Linum grandiflorum]